MAASSSVVLTVAVPTFPTTIPAAQLASAAASSNGQPVAIATAKAATRVSPAPVTSYTWRAAEGMETGGAVSRNKVRPSGPRVTSTDVPGNSSIGRAHV